MKFELEDALDIDQQLVLSITTATLKIHYRYSLRVRPCVVRLHNTEAGRANLAIANDCEPLGSATGRSVSIRPLTCANPRVLFRVNGDA